MRTTLQSFFISIASAIFLMTTQSSAVTVTFSGLSAPFPGGDYIENGIKVSGIPDNSTWAALNGGLHLDDSGSDAGNSAAFSLVSGGTFTVDSFLLSPSGNSYCMTNAAGGCDPFPVNDVLLQGFLAGIPVVQSIFNMGSAAHTETVGAPFSNIDTFVIKVLYPNLANLSVGKCMDAPCQHFTIDNVQLTAAGIVTPVPLPGALGLMVAAIGAAGVGTRFRRQQI